MYTYLCHYTANIEMLRGMWVRSSKAESVGSAAPRAQVNRALSAGLLSVHSANTPVHTFHKAAPPLMKQLSKFKPSPVSSKLFLPLET